MDFRLTRIILIDSYCRSRIVELDVSGHITINGENGSGKTTLLRLIPMFFGESPSRIIRGDAVTERFGRYYFPTTASYVIFEYQRRTHKALSVIHPDGQTGEGVVYRLIDSEYKPELFKRDGQIVQTRDLHRHLDKQGVFDSKPLPLHAYKQIIQNTAGREYRSLAARFSFVGGTGKLTHLERVVTGILQRATTFHDLKRMIVSSVLNGEEIFALRTGRKDLLHWINEYEAYRGIMDKRPVMADLEHADQKRLLIEAEFSRLHARFQLLHDYFKGLVDAGGEAITVARKKRDEAEAEYRERLQKIYDAKASAESRVKEVKMAIGLLDTRKRKYEQEEIDSKVRKVDSIPGWESELKLLQNQLEDLERSVKSLTEIFATREIEAKNLARDQKSELETSKTRILESLNARKDELIEGHRKNLETIRQRHGSEFDVANSNIISLKEEKARIEAEVKNAQADPQFLAVLEIQRKHQAEANAALSDLHDKTDGLRRAYEKARREFDELEMVCNEGDRAIEDSEIELSKLLAADAAGEDTLLGFLRRHRPNWASNIGRVVPPEMLLRTDLAPTISDGTDLYGVSIDLDRIEAGRYASEESIQQEIKLIRARIEKRRNEVAEDRKALAQKKVEMDRAKEAISMHEGAVATAKSRKAAADNNVAAAIRNVEQSKSDAVRRAREALNVCERNLSQAMEAFEALKKEHREELARAEQQHNQNLKQLNIEAEASLRQLDSRKQSIDSELREKLSQIGKDRDACLKKNGVSTEVMNGIREQIAKLNTQIAEANGLRKYVNDYLDWLENTWSRRAAKDQELQTAQSELDRCDREYKALTQERRRVLEECEKTIKALTDQVEADSRTMFRAKAQLHELAHWTPDAETLAAGMNSTIDVDGLISERKRLMKEMEECRDKIRLCVEEICRQMAAVPGTGPEKFYTNALASFGYPRPGKEHEWIEVFRNWFEHEHETNRTSLLQLGKTMAQNISYFWKSLNDFKRNVSTFAADLSANLEEGHVFESISDVAVDIRAEVDTQGYWEAVGNLNQEYETWHANGDPTLPPAGFVAAARQVAQVVGEDKGLVADPVDLISLKIRVNVNNQGPKTASNEHELANISSNGLSYIILCVILIGFVNRIRRKEPVVVPFVVDELKDLSFANAKTLLDLLTRNHITMISAFPDVDLDLAELFDRNYKILPGRKVGLINLDEETEAEIEEEGDHV